MVPNRLEPGKRPMHTLIASIALKDGRPWQVLGCMGADGQPQIHLQSYVGLVDFSFDIQQALEIAALAVGALQYRRFARPAQHRRAFPEATVEELERRGHKANRWPDFCELAGMRTASDRSGVGHARRRRRSEERRRRDRLLIDAR